MSKDKNKKNDDKQTKNKMIYRLNVKKNNFKKKVAQNYRFVIAIMTAIMKKLEKELHIFYFYN